MKHLFTKALVLGCGVFALANIGLADPSDWPFDAQSTTGPIPTVTTTVDPVTAAPLHTKIISSVPTYNWYNGCGPTALGMAVGYWNLHGFSNLVAGDSSWQSTAANNMISSTGNYNDYCLPIEDSGVLLPDKSELPADQRHADDSIADFMHTSQSRYGNSYGWSWYSDIGPAFTEYAKYRSGNYLGTYEEHAFWGDLNFSLYCKEIDANRPVVLLVDSDGDGGTDHFITAIGYSADGKFCYYNTWDSSQHWATFTQMSYGHAWGIYGATFLNIKQVPEPGSLLVLIFGLTTAGGLARRRK